MRSSAVRGKQSRIRDRNRIETMGFNHPDPDWKGRRIMRKRLILTLAVTLAIVPFSMAGKKKPAATATPTLPSKDTGVTIPAAIVEKKVAKLTDSIDWLSSLEDAKKQAKEQGKVILWVHALGDLDGDC